MKICIFVRNRQVLKDVSTRYPLLFWLPQVDCSSGFLQPQVVCNQIYNHVQHCNDVMSKRFLHIDKKILSNQLFSYS